MGAGWGRGSSQPWQVSFMLLDIKVVLVMVGFFFLLASTVFSLLWVVILVTMLVMGVHILVGCFMAVCLACFMLWVVSYMGALVLAWCFILVSSPGFSLDLLGVRHISSQIWTNQDLARKVQMNFSHSICLESILCIGWNWQEVFPDLNTIKYKGQVPD